MLFVTRGKVNSSSTSSATPRRTSRQILDCRSAFLACTTTQLIHIDRLQMVPIVDSETVTTPVMVTGLQVMGTVEETVEGGHAFSLVFLSVGFNSEEVDV